MTSEPNLIFVYHTDSGLFDHKTRCSALAGAITACTDLDALQDFIRQRCDCDAAD